MTRKSFARVERDIKLEKAQQALKNNTCWDDLQQVFFSANELMQKHLVVAGMLRNKELNAYLVDVKAVIENSKILEKDVKLLAADLTALYALHSDKTGGTDDPDVVMHTIGIYEQYQLFIQRHEALIMPTLGSILEQYHIAETRLNVAVEAGREVVSEAVADAAAGIEEGVFTEVEPTTITPELRQTNIGGAGEARYEVVPKDESALAGLVAGANHVADKGYEVASPEQASAFAEKRARGMTPEIAHIDELPYINKEGV